MTPVLVIVVVFQLVLRQLTPLSERTFHVIVLPPPLLEASPLLRARRAGERLAVAACVASVAAANACAVLCQVLKRLSTARFVYASSTASCHERL